MAEVVTLPVVHRSRQAEMEAEAREIMMEIYPASRPDAVDELLANLKRRGFRIVRVAQ